MRLGKFKELLEALDQNMLLVLRGSLDTDILGGFTSYRGYYHHLAIDYDSRPMLVRDMLAECKAALAGQVYEGYKGGDYTMDESTPVWVSSYGSSENHKILKVYQVDSYAVIETFEDDC